MITRIAVPSRTLFYSPIVLLHYDNDSQSRDNRPQPGVFPIRWVLLAALLALVWSWLAVGEPLWVDELHTSWVLADGWSPIAARAAAGNQSPWYFYIVAALGWTVGLAQQPLGPTTLANTDILLSSPWLLRLPSMLAWSLTLATVAGLMWRYSAAAQTRANHGWTTAGWCLCIALDRMQLFYATEARVYSMLQLLSLVGWLLVAHSITSVGLRHRQLVCLTAWTVIATLLIHLHVTSSLVVLCQWLLAAVTAIRLRGAGRLWLTSAVWLGINGWWIAGSVHPVWQRRQLWSAFAGQADLSELLAVFPLLAILMPLLVAWLIARLLHRPAERSPSDCSMKHHVWMWGFAAAGPTLLAWLITSSGIAPLFHYRFIIGGALPLYLLSGYWLVRLPAGPLRWSVVLATLTWLVVSQGTFGHWLRGQPIGMLRGEDWRQAAALVSQRFESQTHQLWCYAGLIEGHWVEPPLADQQNQYLSLPLRGCYRVQSCTQTIEPSALVGSSRWWASQLHSAQPRGDTGQPPLAHWIVARCPAAALEQRLQAAGLHHQPRLQPITQLGRISVVCLRLAKQEEAIPDDGQP
ncbi:MAG: hypothetical protein KF752_15975 [Pirellulaceae bacterium]|nr:hypothetical protein [Pirellulaceae bacterium]